MRVKRGVTARKRHNKIRSQTKGMTLSNRSSVRRGKQAVIKALENAHRDRRERKGNFRRLWNSRINAAARSHDVSYSTLMHGLKDRGIRLNRKSLSEIAIADSDGFAVILKEATKK